MVVIGVVMDKIDVRCIKCNKLLFKADIKYSTDSTDNKIEVRCSRCGLLMTYPSDMSNEFPDVVLQGRGRRGPDETK